ncbi:hypothetical protein AArcSl_2539 [Halalkaliarchaeum desulfuricum]|uniref:Uncharacterized protein n=1 Tax=Halalkaliarchaeum desulfuricum TaxID=2055893 RepID=A0A343TM38_9EURY|nr:hypothetical protein [Halalkaliarchaeum desulfuricum]AUX10160.1 hypothetical protein AArcSl_2539 [Halalkaliarchaeum desulfuricum]
MQANALSAERDVPVAVAIAVLVAFGVLVGIAILNNSWRIWDTAAFCGSYADFYDPPVPEVCLSFPVYLRLSLTHAPHVVPAVLLGILVAIGYVWRRAQAGS